MADKKKNLPKHNIVGIAVWPKLDKPDAYKEGDTPKYKTRLRLKQDDPETIKLVKLLEDVSNQALAEAQEEVKGKRDKAGKQIQVDQALPYTVEIDKDTDTPTGYITVNFTTVKKPPCYDSAKKLMTDEQIKGVWGGSKLRINFSPSPYFMAATKSAGCKCYLNGVQVLEMASRGGSADMFGFTKEDGYEVEETPFSASTDTTEESNDVANAASKF